MKNVWIVATLGSGLVLLVPQARAQTYTRTDAIAYEDTCLVTSTGGLNLTSDDA